LSDIEKQGDKDKVKKKKKKVQKRENKRKFKNNMLSYSSSLPLENLRCRHPYYFP